MRIIHHARIALLSIALASASLATLQAQGNSRPAAGASAEERTARYFTSIARDPGLVRAFLAGMPKGGDLHSHLSGAIYAESFAQWAAEAGLCVDPATMTVVDNCTPPRFKADSALHDPALYRRMIDAWSMRNWEKSGESGHDHFFDTFDKFGRAGSGKTAEMLAEVVRRAQAGGVSYLELMNTADGNRSGRMAARLGWNDNFGTMRDRLLAAGLRDSLRTALAGVDTAEAKMRSILGCTAANSPNGCGVTIRYLYQVLRAFPREQVFAQILAGFEMGSMDSRFVGLNLVQPEDWKASLDNYDLEMKMIAFLRPLYPGVHVSLHAGELAFGMVPPEELCCHIRNAVEIAGAERIGHGVDILYEQEGVNLLDEMARRGVMVEICLTSNDVILGVSGARHPIGQYLAHGVPMALATDDEGVSRIDITGEYVRAALEHGLDYRQLKTMARTSLEHAFAAGGSLWSDPVKFVPVAECAGDRPGREPLSARCRAYLDANKKARLQWDLEAALARFEARY